MSEAKRHACHANMKFMAFCRLSHYVSEKTLNNDRRNGMHTGIVQLAGRLIMYGKKGLKICDEMETNWSGRGDRDFAGLRGGSYDLCVYRCAVGRTGAERLLVLCDRGPCVYLHDDGCGQSAARQRRRQGQRRRK